MCEGRWPRVVARQGFVFLARWFTAGRVWSPGGSCPPGHGRPAVKRAGLNVRRPLAYGCSPPGLCIFSLVVHRRAGLVARWVVSPGHGRPAVKRAGLNVRRPLAYGCSPPGLGNFSPVVPPPGGFDRRAYSFNHSPAPGRDVVCFQHGADVGCGCNLPQRVSF